MLTFTKFIKSTPVNEAFVSNFYRRFIIAMEPVVVLTKEERIVFCVSVDLVTYANFRQIPSSQNFNFVKKNINIENHFWKMKI